MSLRPDMAKAVLRLALGVVALAALTLVIHNYAFNLLPYVYDVVAPGAIKADPGSRLTWIPPFSASEPDRLYDGRSRTRIFEDGAMLAGPPGATAVARTVGGGNWSHDPGVIVFSSSDGSDPRTNSRAYALSYPVLYGRAVGRAALAALVASALGLAWLTRRDSPTVPPAPAAGSHWNRHLVGASLLFLAGLYCCTGSLTPYAITTIPHAAKASTYLYNPDHIHFQALFNFVDGRDRSTWDHALLLRRILYNVLAYPFMKLGGWEVGGTIASLTFNLAAFVAFVLGVRRRVGERGAILAAWLLALYPGAGYWAGLPYLYALIVPVSLVLMVVLAELAERPSWRAMLLCSAALGVANLGYEFFIFFLPASVLVLLGRRRWLAALVSPVIQALPLGLWLFLLQHHFGQDLANSNSSSFGAIAGSYLHVRDPARWLEIIAASPETGMEVFFGANFLFLPLLFLVVAFVNAGTSRVRPGLPEAARTRIRARVTQEATTLMFARRLHLASEAERRGGGDAGGSFLFLAACGRISRLVAGFPIVVGGSSCNSEIYYVPISSRSQNSVVRRKIPF